MYQVLPIGAQFTGKGHQQLGETLTNYENEGWELIQVFPVQVTGCLGLSKQTTNYAVLRRIENRPTSEASA
jgi:hypothetical protein